MSEFIMQYWLQFLFGVITGGLAIGFKWLYFQFKAVKLGMQAILRDNIINQYNKYMELKCIPIYALENVEQMYKQYHALGGNGTITHLYEELQELDVKQKKEG